MEENNNKEGCEHNRPFFQCEICGNTKINNMIPNILTKNGEISYNPQKIYYSLLRETEITDDQAKMITQQVSRFLISKGFKIVSAPMIREIANFCLLSMGLEKERLQYTRIGMPFADVKKLFETEIYDNSLRNKIFEWVESEFFAVKKLISDKS